MRDDGSCGSAERDIQAFSAYHAGLRLCKRCEPVLVQKPPHAADFFRTQRVVCIPQPALLGIALLFLSRGPSQSLHILYGFALALAIPLAATMVRRREGRTASLTFGLMALFAAGLAIRGITTA